MRRIRPLVATTVAAIALTSLSACSAAQKAAQGAAAPMVSVADAMSMTTKATQKYTSASTKMSEQVTAKGQAVDMTGSGHISWSPLAMDMTVTSPQLASKLAGDSSLRMMMSGTTMYMGFTGNAPAAFKGKHWLKMDLSKNAAAAESLNKTSGTDPATQVKLFISSGDIKRVGTQTVDGVSTTRYSGAVDLAKLAAKQEDSQLKSLIQQDSKQGITNMNVDLWVNDQNLPVRVQEATAPSSSMQLKVTIDYSDFSTTPVTITPPAASDTMDLPSQLPSS
ncbi:hypothetical protein NGB36_28190 [Streptomyces sp. RB6PN25]|uniref:Lipoprotein n=1 Tax=Streptomyces humicola TaxID=2953240 RepID=A0ABT1Q353_9ACTN|nr:hypothetical protein [Streptomyces humicola]MCQ4084357.1 hypothetical protein [Streptomyces humicola]